MTRSEIWHGYGCGLTVVKRLHETAIVSRSTGGVGVGPPPQRAADYEGAGHDNAQVPQPPSHDSLHQGVPGRDGSVLGEIGGDGGAASMRRRDSVEGKGLEMTPS